MIKLPDKHLFKTLFWLGLIANIIILDLSILVNDRNSTSAVSSDQKKSEIQITPTDIHINPTMTIVPSLVPLKDDFKTRSRYEKNTSVHYGEVYIPIGSGSSKNSQWDALEGVEINIDTSKYSKITEVYFQVSVRIPTANGEVYTKLYNETEKHDVWFSEIRSQGSEAKLKEAKINLSTGPNLYRVYLKSTLEADAVLDQARIKLIIQEQI